MWKDGRTDLKKLIDASRNFAKAPEMRHVPAECLKITLILRCIIPVVFVQITRIQCIIPSVEHNYIALSSTVGKEIGLEVNADKTKYMVRYRDQNAGLIHSMRIDNSTFDRVEDFKYLGTTLTNQNSIAEEIKSRLKSGNAC